jgi:hypothetical protein
LASTISFPAGLGSIGHRTADFLDVGQGQEIGLLDGDGRFLLGNDLVLDVAQARRPLLLALEHVVDPAQVGLVAFPRTDEILARHARDARGQVEDAALVFLHAVEDVAQVSDQGVGQAGGNEVTKISAISRAPGADLWVDHAWHRPSRSGRRSRRSCP